MLDYLTWIIAGFALLLALMPLAGLERWRMAAAMFALGAGQIYLAVLSLVVLLLIDNQWRITFRQSPGALAAIFVLVGGIVLLAVSQPTDLRTWSELAQLALYVLLFFLFTSRLRNGRDLLILLTACIAASLGVTLLAFAATAVGWVSAPAIFVDRGSNEASVFLALLGVVPCAVMLTRTRNLLYLAAAGPMVLAQYLATSRGSLAVSIIVLLVAGFLWTRSLLIRGATIIGGLAVLAYNVPQLLLLFDAQLNSSARERMALLEYGTGLANERFWTGWGWGSTSRLASIAPNTAQTYPHFHNAYVQMIVELGLLGWIVLAAGLWLVVRWSVIAAVRLRQPGLTALVACSMIGLATACLFDAMLFGADRSVQLIVLLALCSRAVALGSEAQAAARQPRVRRASPAMRIERAK